MAFYFLCVVSVGYPYLQICCERSAFSASTEVLSISELEVKKQHFYRYTSFLSSIAYLKHKNVRSSALRNAKMVAYELVLEG